MGEQFMAVTKATKESANAVGLYPAPLPLFFFFSFLLPLPFFLYPVSSPSARLSAS